jgi:hypothetical protein
MSVTFVRAKRYRHRAEECMQNAAVSQTPGTGETQLLIAQHYLLLAELEKRKTSGQTGGDPMALLNAYRAWTGPRSAAHA